MENGLVMGKTDLGKLIKRVLHEWGDSLNEVGWRVLHKGGDSLDQVGCRKEEKALVNYVK